MKIKRYLIIIFILITIIFMVNPSLTNVLAANEEPRLITPYYNTNHFIVADYVISPSNKDMTSTIVSALNKCKNSGGTVWLERGIYNVSSPIDIPSGCTLMGDWQDPDNYQGTLDYGTKIVVDVNSFKSDNSNLESTGLFKLSSSSGVEGITIYYKNQNINKPKSQPWAFYYGDGMLKSVKNVTIINGYMGIGRNTNERNAHEMLMIENVKGTIIKKGVLIHNSSDVGTITGLSFSPKYLAKANLKAFNDNSSNISESTISSLIKSNNGIGLIITDAEQSQFVNISLSGFKYGVYIPDASVIKTRYMGSGSFYNLNISNCNIGFMVERGIYENKSLIDYRWGYVISNSIIEGREYAVYTLSPVISGKRGTIKLRDVSLKGPTGGDGSLIYFNDSRDGYISVYETTKGSNATGIINNNSRFSNLNIYQKLRNNGDSFTYLSSNSSVDSINKAISNIASSGGGVVYLKPGIYKIDKPINVLANVELRGSSSSSNRRFNVGTTFNVVNNIRAVNLTGNNSGIAGINIIYENNVNMLSRGSTYNQYDYAIAMENNNRSYVKNVTISAGPRGIYVNKSSYFSLENIITGTLENAIKVDNSNNGLIMNTLQNGTVICRNNLYSIDEGKANFNYIMNPNTKKKLRYISLNNDNDIELQNIFAYGSYVLITTNNSRNIYAVNIGYDGNNINVIENTNSTGIAINSLRMSGNAIKNNGGSFGVYNNLTINGSIGERDISSNMFKVSKKYLTPILKSSSSVNITSLSNKSVSYQYDGDGKIRCTSSNNDYVKCSVSNKEIVLTPIKNTISPVTISIIADSGPNYLSKTITMSVTVNSSSKFIRGDVDGNGKVGINDYIKVRNHILKIKLLSSDELLRADVNNKSGITASDYLEIRKIILGLN